MLKRLQTNLGKPSSALKIRTGKFKCPMCESSLPGADIFRDDIDKKFKCTVCCTRLTYGATDDEYYTRVFFPTQPTQTSDTSDEEEDTEDTPELRKYDAVLIKQDEAEVIGWLYKKPEDPTKRQRSRMRKAEQKKYYVTLTGRQFSGKVYPEPGKPGKPVKVTLRPNGMCLRTWQRKKKLCEVKRKHSRAELKRFQSLVGGSVYHDTDTVVEKYV